MLSEVAISKLADIEALDKELIKCDGCLRLKLWREEVAVTKRRAYQDETYWGKPVPGFGPVDAQIILVGLAPGAHGANRTGRIFTGDASGDWLFPELFSAGLANQPTSKGIDDGLQLINTRVLCVVRCVPPDNKAETSERDTCSVWFNREIELLMPSAKVFVALGAFAWDSLWREGHPLIKLATDGQLQAFEHAGFWQPMDTLRDKTQLEDLWASGKAPWKTWQ